MNHEPSFWEIWSGHIIFHKGLKIKVPSGIESLVLFKNHSEMRPTDSEYLYKWKPGKATRETPNAQ